MHALVGVKWLVCMHDLKMLVSLVGSDIMPCNSKAFEKLLPHVGGTIGVAMYFYHCCDIVNNWVGVDLEAIILVGIFVFILVI